MIRSPAWAGKHYAVLGLARSGQATVSALFASGADVTAWDSDEARRDQAAGCDQQPCRGHEGADDRQRFQEGDQPQNDPGP